MYRTVRSSLWREPWFEQLPLSGKCVYLYLITGADIRPNGTGMINRRRIAFDMDLTDGQVDEAFTSLNTHIIEFPDYGILWLPGFAESQGSGQNWKRAIEKANAETPPDVLRAIGYPATGEWIPLQSPLVAPPDPLPTPSKGAPIPLPKPNNGPEDSFDILLTIPGAKPVRPEQREHCLEWIRSQGISERRARETALSLAAKWGGPKYQYVDVWRTFQKWVERPPLGNTRVEAHSDPEDFSRGW